VAFAVKSQSALASVSIDSAKISLDSTERGGERTIAAFRQALAGTVVGTQIATSHSDFLERYFSDVVEIRHFDTLDNLAVNLDTFRIDAAFAPQGFWKKLVEGDNGVDLTLIGPPMTGNILGRGVGLGFRKEDSDLLRQFDSVIKEAMADGTITRLSEQWFGFDLSC
jgi:octopine/nopaline transport system substrate-binding protein